MADSDWVDDTSDGDWVDDNTQAPLTDTEQPSAVTSGIRKLASGLSGGFLDELSGAGEAAGRALGVKGLGGEFSDVGLSDDGPTMDWETLRDAYRSARDRKRAALQQDSDVNPGSSFVGEMTGMVASPINKIAKGMSLAKGGAALGAVNALGNSDAESIGEMALDTAGGGALGFAGGKALGTLGSGAREIIDDVATAPLGQSGERGIVAKALDGAHRFGKGANEVIDNVVQSVTPSTGSQQADAMIKGIGRLGRYGLAGKVQGAVDTLEHAPRAAQWMAQKASPMLDKIARSPYGAELAQRSPQVFNAVAGKMVGQKEDERKPYDDTAILSATQGTKYNQVLESAKQRGDTAFGAAHFLLQSRDPEYRELTVMDEDQADSEEDFDDYPTSI